MTNADLQTPYQILDPQGCLVGEFPADVTKEQLLKWYRVMWLTRLFSNKIVSLQRQGRATTWIPSLGQEAAAVGLATALQPQDWLTGSPREIGGYFLKGVPPAAIAYFTRGYPPPAALFGNKPLNCLPLTIVIGTQTVQSVGLAMAAKIKGDNAVVVCSCGDGASSEGDFSEALNFAGVFKLPLVMVVVNNGWSISVPRSKQSAALYLAWRGEGFGLPARLVDGNDILAMHSVMQEAVARARAGDGATLVEAITYRRAAHSTADDPTRYCPPEEITFWEARDPLDRLQRFLYSRGWLDDTSQLALIQNIEGELASQIAQAYAHPIHPNDWIFSNVYGNTPPRLVRQRAEMNQLG